MLRQLMLKLIMAREIFKHSRAQENITYKLKRLMQRAKRLLTEYSSKFRAVSRLRQANLEPETVESLSLEKCEDLVCKNLMCEKLGEVCVCKLARWSSINGPNLTNLKCMDLADNGLSVLPDSVFDLTQIQYLNVSRNSFTEFPVGIKRLKNLKVLDISDNDLTGSLPQYLASTIFDQDTRQTDEWNGSYLPNLEVLCLRNNKSLLLPSEDNLLPAWKYDQEHGIFARV